MGPTPVSHTNFTYFFGTELLYDCDTLDRGLIFILSMTRVTQVENLPDSLRPHIQAFLLTHLP